MPSSAKDPRSYIKPLPLPTNPHHGIRIQARSATVYNPTVPTRDDMRKDNYKRRQKQLHQQGFCSVNYKPYEGIGDPFFLDQKKLILHALGQWNENETLDCSSCSDSSEDENGDPMQQMSNFTPANFMLQKQRHGLNSLSKEMSHSRDMIRNVRLGHGLFQMLQRENEAKTQAQQRELQETRRRMWNDWQPPKTARDSDSDLSEDEDIEREVELGSYMVQTTVHDPTDHVQREDVGSAAPVFLTESSEVPVEAVPGTRSVGFKTSHVATPVNAEGETSKSVTLHPSSASRQRNKKKMAAIRPYTPQHSNISTDQSALPDSLALFRQLCSLHWLLEAMNCDVTIMGPITTCWHLKDMGGHKAPGAKKQKDRLELRWRDWKLDEHNRNAHKRQSAHRPSLRVGRRGSALPHPHHRGSVASSAPSLSGSQSMFPQPATPHQAADPSGGFTPGGPGTGAGTGAGLPSSLLPRAIPEGRESESGSSEQDPDVPLQKGLATDPGDVRGRRAEECPANNPAPTDRPGGPTEHPTESPTEGVAIASVAASQPVSSDQSPRMTYKGDDVTGTDPSRVVGVPGKRPSTSPKGYRDVKISKELREQILEEINRGEDDPRLHKLANPQERCLGLAYRAEHNVRPRSTPAVLQYTAALLSHKTTAMPHKMRRGFDEVKEEKSLVLHDTLDAVDRARMRKMRTMFVNMPTRTSLPRALEQIRRKPRVEEDSAERRRRSATHQQWYMELLNAIPDDTKEGWYFKKILAKLSKYGLRTQLGGNILQQHREVSKVEASKQSAYKFLRVIQALRDWEICSPDISAAVEFCRERIVEMSVEEYEQWFSHQFPGVTRPQTAPPAGRSRAPKNSEDDASPRPLVTRKSALLPQSAPARGRQQ